MKIKDVELYFLPVTLRVPLKFGAQVLENVTCARARVTLESADGATSEGWGETPLSVPWVWPSGISYSEREGVLKDFCLQLSSTLPECGLSGHPMELGYDFIEGPLPEMLDAVNASREEAAKMPHLAALVCFSPFDIAVHDAFAKANGVGVYDLYTDAYMTRDLSQFFGDERFKGQYPADYLVKPETKELPVWHLVGGLDPISEGDLTGSEPDDGYPVLLRDWIRSDGLNCLKVKLRGNDADWDYARLVAIGEICEEENVDWLTTDFNCTVEDVGYVNGILDRLRDEYPRAYQRILYVEQPFPYDLEANPIDVHSLSARKPLFMDESAHDWRFVKMGRELGWTGVALKTCKTQTGAILSLCWAKAHGMTLMVQDLTNPMLAQIPHVLLAAHAGTIMGVESNGMQFYPAASAPEEVIHPGLYRRRNGVLNWSTLDETGYGYREGDIERELPDPVSGKSEG
jgi:L-alanine-DL-glutamate epimerase-like enolase superfamily enzyme